MSSETSTPVESHAWGTVWSVLTALTVATGLVCAWRRDGVVNVFGAALLMTFVAAAFTTSIARAVEYSFRWRLIAWPAAACIVLVSTAGLAHVISVWMLVLVALLGFSSPWVISLAAAHILQLGRRAGGRQRRTVSTSRIRLTQTEVDRRFDDIVSRL